MAKDTFYLLSSSAVAGKFAMQLGGSAPARSSLTDTGGILRSDGGQGPAAGAVAPVGHGVFTNANGWGPAPSSLPTVMESTVGYRSPTLLSKKYAGGNFVLSYDLYAGSQRAIDGTVRLRVLLAKGTNANGYTGYTAIGTPYSVTAKTSAPISANAYATVTGNIAVAQFELVNQYLAIAMYLEVVDQSGIPAAGTDRRVHCSVGPSTYLQTTDVIEATADSVGVLIG